MGQSDRTQILPLHIQGVGQCRHNLILSTRETKKKNPWLTSMRKNGELFKEYGPDYVKTALMMAAGKQTNLEKFS
jgi:hypothetical protein